MDKVNFMPTATPASHTPMLSKMKRKREDRSPSLSKDLPAPKRTETASRVQAPATHTQQTALSLPTAAKNAGETPDVTRASQSCEPNTDPALSFLHAHPPRPCNQAKPIHGPNHDDNNDNSQHPSTAAKDLSALRETIEAQFGLEVLLKHKELRLIDQEFAKCQIALEQLRRCQIIPYPAMSSDYGAMQAASSGSGAAFKNRAPHASPWGVADGPYTRHYQRWLIPDSTFDDTFVEDLQTPVGSGKRMPDRATRGSKSEIGAHASNSRSHRGSTNSRLKALPHGYPEPKEEKGPMIVKRSSDGKMVKLVCLDCRRSNFNSAQGFINHCRIAHSRQFLSHDAAIEASGEEIDVDAEGGVGETSNVPQVTASSALVHPLIRSSAHLARTASTEASATKRKRTEMPRSSDHPPSATVRASQAITTPQQPKLGNATDPSPFKPSPQTPHLSALFAKLGRGGNLEELVSEAKTKPEIDLSPSSDEEEDDDVMDVAAGTSSAPQSRSTRGVVRQGPLPARRTYSVESPEKSPIHRSFPDGPQKPAPPSSIGGQQNYPSPDHSDHALEGHHSLQNGNSPFNLSPNTIEAHTAPSLVSDDGDYENTHSESESPSSAEADDDDDHYIHAELMDHDDLDLGERGPATHHIGLGGKPHAPAVRRRSSAMRPPASLQNGEPHQRHVTFASPVRRQRRGSKAGNRK
ncbi:hypothetical protein ACLMJK_007253 [Lecanora helva]